jgi:hypothetical protein
MTMSEYFVEAIHNRHPTCRHFEQRALQTTSLDSFAYLQLCHLDNHTVVQSVHRGDLKDVLLLLLLHSV